MSCSPIPSMSAKCGTGKKYIPGIIRQYSSVTFGKGHNIACAIVRLELRRLRRRHLRVHLLASFSMKTASRRIDFGKLSTTGATTHPENRGDLLSCFSYRYL